MNKKAKSTVIVAGVLCIVSIASAQTVVSGTFGFVKVEKPAGTLNLVGNNFGDDGSTLNEIAAVEQFTGSVFFSEADRVIVYNAGAQSYATYALFDDTAYAGTTVEWRSGDDFTGSAVNPTIPAGSGFWVQSVGSSVDTNLVISGTVVSSQSVTNQILGGLQMLAYPFSMIVDLNATQLRDNATGSVFFSDADRVIAWNVATQTYETYALFDDTAYAGSTVEWRDGNNFTIPAGAISVELGSGFWYDAKGEFLWAETSQYYGNL